MKTLNGLFHDYTMKVEEAIDLKTRLDAVEQEAALLKAEICKEPRLHDELLGNGVLHNGDLFKKKVVPANQQRPFDEGVGYYLVIEDYVEPKTSAQLDGKGD